MPITSTTEISRAKLAHPDFDHQGGSALHTKVATLLTRLGDFIDSRFFYQNALANSSSVDFDHNFKSLFSDLTVLLYLRDTGTGELTKITPTSTPSLSQFTIAATPSFTTTKIRITNSSGSSRDIAAVVIHGKTFLGQLFDVDLTTTPPSAGNALGYDGAKWVPQAGSGLATAITDGLIEDVNYENFTARKTSAYSCTRGDKVLTDTSGGSFTVTIPNGTENGDRIEIIDFTGSWATNNLTITAPGGPSDKINGVVETTIICDVDWGTIVFIYDSAFTGWKLEVN